MTTSTAAFGRDLDDIDTPEPDPIRLACSWLPSNSGEARPVMTLSTVDGDGYPDARNMLLSKVDRNGLYFHTDVSSRKVRQLTLTPKAAVALVWPEAERQLVVVGNVRRTDEAESSATYRERSRYLQVLAWINTDDTAQLPLAARRDRWAAFDTEHPDGSLTAPAGWVGFVLEPIRLTFWRGDPEGPSNRIEYRRVDGGWAVARLPG